MSGTVRTTTRSLQFALAAVGAVLLLAACGSTGSDGAATTTTAAAATTTTPAAATTAPAGPTTTASPEGGAPAAWTADAQQYRGKDGQTFDFTCPPGGAPDTVWGVETYTDDSSVCTAAVHVGLITLAEGGKVTIEIAAGQDSYDAGTAHQITSQSYASWGGSFTFPDAPPGSGTFAVSPASWSVSARSLGLQLGDTKTVSCSPGGAAGSVWGTDTYTADSSICTAAVHQGLFAQADGGKATIEVVAGQQSYEGTAANGITTQDYPAYDLSFTFPKDQPS